MALRSAGLAQAALLAAIVLLACPSLSFGALPRRTSPPQQSKRARPSAVGGDEQIVGPATPADWPQWLQQAQQYRKDAWQRQQYNGSIYVNNPSIEWTQRCWIQPQMHPYDRYFYDPQTRSYTVDRYLDDLKERYGGIDCLLLWPTYTNIGIDNRNQYDQIRSMPGHVAGIAQVIQQLHARGVRVLYPYNPWDQGTRPEGKADPDALAALIAETSADGFNGDTMGSVPVEFWLASVRVGRPIGIEPEGGGSEQSINWDTMGWGYWEYPHVPSVDRWKWLDPRRMTNVCNRWAHDKVDDLQAAFFNGDGYESWENVWGIWNGITPRAGEAIRRIGAILRRFGNGNGNGNNSSFLHSMLWEPYTPTVNSADVFASKWPRADGHPETFWTLVNRNTAKNYTGPQLTFTAQTGLNYYDCYHGVQLDAQRTPKGSNEEEVTLSFMVEAGGYGAVLATANTTQSDRSLAAYLATMGNMTRLALEAYSDDWHDLKQQMVPIPSTPIYSSPPKGMVRIPGGVWTFATSGVEIEGGNGPGQDVQFPWEDAAFRDHRITLQMVDFYIDKYPVTNQQYQEYLQATKYSPADNWNYLKDWDNHTFPQGWANKPVTWVSLNEARAYCGWAGKRLPHVYEWQYAAQGNTSNPYPWGTASDPTRVPQPDSGRSMRGPDDVDAHSPAGDSPFGVADLLGNVWQYTDEFQDDHTRTVVLKGGSYYRPSGSMWYFPQCTQLTQHNKYMLMDDAYERSGALGFRCAADATKDSPKPYVPTCNSTLCGRLDVRVPQSVDLTKEASQAADGEWAHWGTTTPLSVDRKKLANGAQHRISDASVLGGSAQQYNNNPNAYVWTDGEPDATGSTTTGIYVAGTGKGFKLTVPASATNTTLRVYVGVWNSHATFTATLDDGLSPAYTSSDLSSAAGTMNGVYEIQFRSSKPGATLTVTFTQTGEDNGEGNVTLQSASLFATPSPASDLSN